MNLAEVVSAIATVVSAITAYVMLRTKVQVNEAAERLRKEIAEQMDRMREDLLGDIKERVQKAENNFEWLRDRISECETKDEVNRLRDRQHQLANNLVGVQGYIEQSKSTHERIARVEERMRDLERRG